MKKYLALFVAGCAVVLFGSPLSIPKETSFTVSVPFPEATYPAGRLHKETAPEWKVVSLDGNWRYRTVPFVKGSGTPKDSGISEGLFRPGIKDSEWAEIPVPVSFYTFPKYHTPSGQIAYYRKTLDVPASDLRKSKRTILDFRRVADRADVWINGKPAGESHFGRESSFQYDITDLLHPGKNLIAVRVYSYFGHKSYSMRQLGGICDSVRMIVTDSAFFIPRAMITPDLADSSVFIELETISHALEKGVSVEIFDASGKKVASCVFRNTFQKGHTRNELGKVKISSPRLWDPQDPHLYTARFLDSKGRPAGYEKFAFRSFSAKGEWLYLNGKKFKPRMYTSFFWQKENQNNENSMTEKMIRLYKDRLHINMIRPHSGAGIPFEHFYILCDRIGMLVYYDWSGPSRHLAYDRPWNKSIRDSAPEFLSVIRDTYRHPSIVMWSFANEIYESHFGLYFSKDLDELYTLVKQLDRQNRPICSSTGRQTLEAIQTGLLKERTDIVDDHQYRGSYCGSWQENIGHIETYARTVAKYYGAIPKLDAEYGVPGDCARYRGITAKRVLPVLNTVKRNDAAFKRAYADLLRDPTPEIGSYLRLKSNFATPEDYIKRRPVHEKFARFYAKRPIEIFRRAGIRCIGGHTNAQWYDLIRDFDDDFRKASNDTPLSPSSEWRVMPLFYEIARCYNPLLVSAEVFNTQPYAGAEVAVSAVVTNDLSEDGVFRVVPQLRLENGKVMEFPALDFGKIPGMEQKKIDFRFRAPDTGKIERGNLEFYLFRNGKRVGDNYYEMSFFPRRKIVLPMKCALYDSTGIKFRGLLSTPTTLSSLRNAGAKFTTIRNFSNLNQFTHLILGKNAFDRVVMENGDVLFNWVENGGKLLVLEQSFCGKIPFLANYSIVSGNPGTLVTVVDPNHPVFRNFRQTELDSWFGNLGRMSSCGIAPLDAGMVAVTPFATFMDRDSMKSVLCDVKLGKGEIILSQIDASDRLAESGAAGEYFASLIACFSRPDVSEYALELPGAKSGKVVYLENRDALFIDLSKFANRSFTDSVAGDRKGGWTDFGASADFHELPLGETRLQGGVPFRIIDPEKNNGKSCIVLKSKHRTYFPESVKNIPVNALLNSIFCLHTAMYARNPGTALRYVLHFEDGKFCEFTADTRFDLPDWWQAKAAINAVPVFRRGSKSLFMSEFVNPRPNIKVISMDIIGGYEPVAAVVAITGRVRFSSTVSGVGEK